MHYLAHRGKYGQFASPLARTNLEDWCQVGLTEGYKDRFVLGNAKSVSLYFMRSSRYRDYHEEVFNHQEEKMTHTTEIR